MNRKLKKVDKTPSSSRCSEWPLSGWQSTSTQDMDWQGSNDQLQVQRQLQTPPPHGSHLAGTKSQALGRRPALPLLRHCRRGLFYYNHRHPARAKHLSLGQRQAGIAPQGCRTSPKSKTGLGFSGTDPVRPPRRGNGRATIRCKSRPFAKLIWQVMPV